MGKRANGEGSVFQRKDGMWVGRLQLSNGKRWQAAAKTQAAALKKLQEARPLVAQGVVPASARLTVEAYLTLWLKESATPKLKVTTLVSYQHYVNHHIVPVLGRKPLTKLSAPEVQAWLNAKAASRLAPRTVQYMHAILRTALNRAVKWQLVPRNVALLVDPPRGAAAEIHPLSPVQVTVLLSAYAGHPQAHLYAFLLATGLRLGEALALRWQDVDLERKRLHVRHTLERLRGRPWQLTEPKSASGQRVVPLISPAVTALEAQREVLVKMRKAAGSAWVEHFFVFPSTVGTPLDGTNALHAFKRMLKRADLPTTHRLHDLRHSAATYLLAAGVDRRIVMQIMGWSQLSMLTRYQHVLDPMLDDAAARLEAVFPVAAGGG